MSLVEDASRAFAPHTQHVTDRLCAAVDQVGDRIESSIREALQQSDLGRPDTGDNFKFFIVTKKKLLLETVPINLATNVPNDDPGPTLGEIWAIQSICVNGQAPKSPGFSIRTNTGRLIFAVVPEGMGNESVGGDVILLQGETLLFEPLAEGVFDFTLSVLLRKYRRRRPDAGHGVSQEHYETQSRTQEHEPERDFPGHSYVPEEDYVGIAQVGGNVSPDPLIAVDPYDGSV